MLVNPISQFLNHTISSSILVRAVNETSTQYFMKLFPLMTTRATIVAQGFFVVTHQPLQLHRCSNPLQMRKVFLVLSKKIFLIGVRGSPGVGSQSWVFFVSFTNFDGPWTPIPWTKILAQTVFGNYAISLVDQALACPTSMS